MSVSNLEPNSKQTIEFHLEDDDMSVLVHAEDVTVVSSPGSHHTGSPKVKIHNIVDYCWEEKFYLGQLLAVHMEGKYIAYGIKAIGKSNSVLRVVNRETSKRSLIKGIEGLIEDLAFARIPTQVILASLDNCGTLLVHKICETREEITCELLLHVVQSGDNSPGVPHRVFWCSYIPEDSDSGQDDFYDEISRLLAVTRNDKIELWNLATIFEEHGSGPFRAGEDIDDGFLEIEAHAALVVDASFSPDGTAIATASADGDCKFYQVYMHSEGEPRCLHQWKPHDGKPVSSLFFLDDHRNYNPDVQFWKFAVTGADHNTELKLWSCETWQCLQTIRFTSRTFSSFKLKASMDLAAGFILMSDMFHRVLYILQLQKENSQICPYVCSISEFKLPYPILSFGIIDAGVRLFKPNTSFILEDICTGEGDKENPTAVVVRMYLVQPKSLQECHIVFQTPSHHAPPLSVITHDSLLYQDGLSDLSNSLEMNNPLQDGTVNHNSLQINLMTPDAFNSPIKHSSPATASHIESSSPHADSKPTVIMSPQNENAQVMGFTSGGSSPSREVQEILSLKESPCYYLEQNKEQPPDKKWLKSSEVTIKTTKSVCSGTDLELLANTGKSQDVLEAISNIRHDVNTLLATVKEQNRQFQELKEEIRGQHCKKSEWVEEGLERWWLGNKGRVADDFGQIQCAIDQAALTAAITQAIAESCSTQLHNVLRPAVTSSLDKLKDMIQTDLSKKLTTTDQLLKENLSKLVRNKSVIESLTNVLVSTATPAMTQCYKESITKATPAFERACDTMFQQITQTFGKGTQEYIKEMEKFTETAENRAQEELRAISAGTEAIGQATQLFLANVDRASRRLEECVAEVINRGLRVGMNNGSLGVRSQTVTPAPHMLQAQLAQLIAQGHYNSAFQQALSASDLSLVMYVCEKVAPGQVFTEEGCLLQQHVLLSLIQQLSADMSHHTEVKHKYLEEAVITLDPSNKGTREHMPTVLGALHKQLQAYIDANPTSSMTKRVRMLQMATQSLLS